MTIKSTSYLDSFWTILVFILFSSGSNYTLWKSFKGSPDVIVMLTYSQSGLGLIPLVSFSWSPPSIKLEFTSVERKVTHPVFACLLCLLNVGGPNWFKWCCPIFNNSELPRWSPSFEFCDNRNVGKWKTVIHTPFKGTLKAMNRVPGIGCPTGDTFRHLLQKKKKSSFI